MNYFRGQPRKFIQREKGSGLMRRLFILSSFAMMIVLGIAGCGGGGEGTSADPLGTDSITFGHKNDTTGTDWSMAVQVTPGATVVLTAKVKNAIGNAVVGREVSFRLLGTSGATINVSRANTDGAGEAAIIYRAGLSFGFDTVRASISNGSQMDMNITVGTTGTAGRKIALIGTPTVLSSGQNSILTATVTDGDDNPVMGQFVSFAYISNLSGATLTTLNGGITDASGHAIAVSMAGSLVPTVEVQDIVETRITGMTSAAVSITRTASIAIPPAGNRLGLASDLTSLDAGQNAVITATVTNASGVSVSGVTVTFSLLNNTTGAALATLAGGVTDAGGKAIAVYTAGASTPGSSLQDTIQASITGSTGALVMTRTAAGGGGGGGFRMTVTAEPTSLKAGALSVITAIVANAAGPVAGQTVTFAFVTNNSGAILTTVNATTDAGGSALATYTAGNNLPGLSIQDAVSASVPGSTGAVILTRLPATGTGNRISLTLNPNLFPLPTTSSNCIVTATVVRDDGITPVANETVTFSILSGAGTIAPTTAVTNNSGTASAVFTAPGGPTGFEAIVRAQIPNTTNGGDAVGIIRW